MKIIYRFMNSRLPTLAIILDRYSDFTPDKTISFQIAEFAKNCITEHIDKWNIGKQFRSDNDKAYDFINELIDGYINKHFTNEQIIYEIKRLFNIKSSIYEFENLTNNKTKSQPLHKFKNNDKLDNYFDNIINFVHNEHFIVIEFNTNEILGRK